MAGMKRIILFLVLCSIFFTGSGQNLIINDTIYKDGIYWSFEEFKHNTPSLNLTIML